jgi:DnaJ-domain-containing protein 1
VSIGKRFINLVRSNINAVLDRSRQGRSGGGSAPLEDLSDAEIEAELARRRSRREAAERAVRDSDYSQEDWDEVERATREGTGRYRTTGRRTGTYRRTGYGATGARRSTSTPGTPARDPRLAQLYAQLECPYGADLNAVRKQYRAMMRKYHPDMHSGNADKQRLATDLSQRLTMAYNELRRLLTGSSK